MQIFNTIIGILSTGHGDVAVAARARSSGIRHHLGADDFAIPRAKLFQIFGARASWQTAHPQIATWYATRSVDFLWIWFTNTN